MAGQKSGFLIFRGILAPTLATIPRWRGVYGRPEIRVPYFSWNPGTHMARYLTIPTPGKACRAGQKSGFLIFGGILAPTLTY
jgi:hypothetical protein